VHTFDGIKMTLVAERIDKPKDILNNVCDWFHRRIANKCADIQQDKIQNFIIYSKSVSMTPMK